MQVNTNVYGAPETWVNILPLSGYHEDNENKAPVWLTIVNGITAGVIDYPNQIDNSICYAAIAADSPAAGITTCNMDSMDDERTINDKEDFFPAFIDIAQNSTYQIPYYTLNDDENKQIYSPNESLAISNTNRFVMPFCSLSPKDCVLKITVRAFNTDFTDFQTYDAGEYISTYATTYPNIAQICGVPYYRTPDGTPTARIQYTSDPDKYGGFYFARMSEFSVSTWGNVVDYVCTNHHTTGTYIVLWGQCNANGLEMRYESDNYVCKFVGDGTVTNKTYNGNDYICMLHEFTGDDFIQRVAASYGLFFCLNETTATTGDYNSPSMFLGIIDEQGLCHGDYTNGESNEEQPQYTWDSTNDSTYNPGKPFDPNIYDRQTVFNNIGNLATTTKRYVLNAAGVGAIMSDLYTISGDIMTDSTMPDEYTERMLDNFLTNNPTDCIISLEKYPLDGIPKADTSENIVFGRVQGQTIGYPMPYTSLQYDFKTIDIYPRFGGCFLDFNPYTVFELYIPFCGTVEINPADFMGRRLQVRMYIDFTTGTCTAYILSDKLVIKSVNGECSIKIPLSGIDSATMAGQISNAILQERQAYTTVAGKQYTDLNRIGAKYNALSFLYDTKSAGFGGSNLSDKIMSRKNSQKIWSYSGAAYNLEHQVTSVHQIGGATAATGWAIDLQCRLICYYPTGAAITYNAQGVPHLNDLTAYAHLNGFATLEHTTLSNFKGFTVCTDIDLSNCAASETEKDMIKGFLQNGVYI